MIDKHCYCSLPAFRYELSSRENRYDAWSGDTSKKKLPYDVFVHMRLQSIHTGFSLASGAFLSEQRLLQGPYVDILFGINLETRNDEISRCSTAI
jgi:hypothetical protein